MKKREMTVYRARGTSRDENNPLIMLQGKWLRDVGFSAGDRILVTCGDSRLIVERTGKLWPGPKGEGMVAEETAEYGGKGDVVMADLDMALAKIMGLKTEIDEIFKVSTFDDGQDLRGLEDGGMDTERCFLLDGLRDVLKKLADVQGSLEYISRPVAEVSVLHRNGSQYETGNGYSYCSGSLIEALIPDPPGGVPRWVHGGEHKGAWRPRPRHCKAPCGGRL